MQMIWTDWRRVFGVPSDRPGSGSDFSDSDCLTSLNWSDSQQLGNAAENTSIPRKSSLRNGSAAPEMSNTSTAVVKSASALSSDERRRLRQFHSGSIMTMRSRSSHGVQQEGQQPLSQASLLSQQHAGQASFGKSAMETSDPPGAPLFSRRRGTGKKTRERLRAIPPLPNKNPVCGTILSLKQS